MYAEGAGTDRMFQKWSEVFFFPSFFKDFTYLVLERGKERERRRERNIPVWFPFARLPPGTWPETQAYALPCSQTGDPLVHRQALNPLSHQP